MEIWGMALLIINLFGYSLMGIDKSRAKKNQYRISERTLWLVALFGGAIGTTVGMERFRHKTKHLSFKLGFPVLAVIQIVVFTLLLT